MIRTLLIAAAVGYFVAAIVSADANGAHWTIGGVVHKTFSTTALALLPISTFSSGYAHAVRALSRYRWYRRSRS